MRSWFKGADTRAVMRFIEWTFGRSLADLPDGDENERYMNKILETARHGNECLRQLYACALWLPPDKAAEIGESGLCFIRCFNNLAAQAYHRRLPRFQLVCKIHMFAHVCHGLLRDARSRIETLNPVAYSCQMDEDFVGKVCSMARSTHAKTLHERTLQRYKVNLAIRW